MFARLFQKPSQSESQESHSPQSDGARQSMTPSEMAPLVGVHYGIPSTASILAFDPIQRLLAVGTLDGRIKVVGGDNIEGLLISPKALPFKNLEFLQNQGFLASVSNENEIQVWDLVKRCIPSKVKWESNITAFSVIPGTNYMYVGDEYGFLSVLKYDAEQGDILHLPYHIPPNLIAEEAGVSMPEHQSIVGVLSQPCSCESRVLIAYESGLIILWDVTKDKAVHVKCSKDIQLKGGTVLKFSDNQSHTYQNDSIDNEEAEKELSSLCWVSPDGSVLAGGYVDGDILLWNLSVSENGRSPTITKPLNDVVKVQLSSGDRRLPVIVLHWSPSKGQSGQLFAYGGEEIGSEKVLAILELDWSSGLSKLKCIERVDLALHGSFADVIMIPNSYKTDNNAKSLFVLTNPGQLHFYEYTSLSILKSETRNSHPVHTLQYHSVIPTVEPFMTVGKLCMLNSEREMFSAPLEKVSVGGGSKWPLTGGVLYEVSPNESNNSRRIYIGGYQNGSVRIWDATIPVLSLVYEFGFEIKGIEVAGANASVSALDFCSTNSTLAIGNENGVIFLYRLQGNSNQTTVNIVTETKNEVHNYLPEERNHCSTIYALLSSPISSLQFATSGVRLFAGFECGQVAVLDINSPSISFVTDCVSSSQSPVISLVAQSSPEAHENETETESAKEIAFILTRDAHMAMMDSTTGKITNSWLMHPEEKSIAISMHLLEVKHPLVEGSKDDSNSSSHHIEAESQSSQSNPPTESDLSETEAVQSPSLDHKTLPSHILLCCEDAFYFYPMKSFIQRDSSFVHKLKLEKPCSWTTIVKRDAEKCGLVVVYQTGEIEMRSLPELQLLGKTSMISILRWNFNTNMDKAMSSSDKGQITLVNGNEFTIVSLLASDNEFRVPETLPCLHDVVLAAAANTEFNFSQNQKKVQVINSGIPGFGNITMRSDPYGTDTVEDRFDLEEGEIGDGAMVVYEQGPTAALLLGLKGVKEEQEDMNYTEAREIMMGHLEKTFSRFPFSSSSNAFDIDELLLEIDDMNFEEPVPSASSSHKSSPDVKGKVSEREKLFEGGSTDTKPTVRTREEIIAKYRKTDDAASAASQAKEKLMERKEKLEKLSLHSEELQNGAEDFASLAKQIAKQMEKRKWWQL